MLNASSLRPLLVFALTATALTAPALAADPTAIPAPTPAQEKFFEDSVRPILVANCYKCHAIDKPKGELRLDSREAALAGGESGPALVPGQPEKSLLIEAIKHESLEMPPKTKLKDEEIAALTEWVKIGAPWPGEHGRGKLPVRRDKITDADRAFWSFQPVARAMPPAFENDAWSRGTIDRFLLARLRAEGLEPAAAAPPEMLVRRVYFDLTGLPPTAAQLDAYLADTDTSKYEKLVDQLLDSPRYGERWARHWLDLVRYADSDGYKQDSYRPTAWRYRDYVIKSLNDDKPYDQFIREQLAGDEIAPGDPAALAATGYLRAGQYEYNLKDARTQWNFILNDITDVTADVFLGMGMSCARCHDHKFDPILQEDYYKLRSFFAAMLPRDDVPLATPEARAKYDRDLAVWLDKTAEIRQQIDELERSHLKNAADDELDKFPLDIAAMVLTPPPLRGPLEMQLGELAWRQAVDKMDLVDFPKTLKGEELDRWKRLREDLKAFDKDKPANLPAAMTARDVGPVAAPTLMPAGRKAEGVEVVPGFLTILDPAPASITPPASGHSTGRRTALANWLTRADHPLTTRVIVNRLWQQHFGRGLVGTASDFGALGERPSHPELLDYLATQLVENGWRLKPLHRLMVTSAAYRQTALRPAPEKAKAIDPTNRLLWRMNTRRLEAEQIRDAMLAASGDLVITPGGEGVSADQPRRSIYTRMMRNKKDALLEVFDVADGLLSTPLRNVTTTPTQALLMINSVQTMKLAGAWSDRLSAQKLPSDVPLIDAAYRTAFARLPTDSERNDALDFLTSGPRDERLLDLLHALLNANEFLYVD